MTPAAAASADAGPVPPMSHGGNEAVEILLLSQVFPPAVGGSGELLANVYGRIDAVPVSVWTDAATCPGADERRGPLRIRRTRLDGRCWGVTAAGAVGQHLRLARDILRAAARRSVVVHCARAQPEGVPALLASLLRPHTPFLFWVHGEDVSTALTSRELTWTMRRVHAGASVAIANSHNSARVLAAAGFDPARIRVVHPGVDSARFHPEIDGRALRARFGAAPGRLLLSVGRLQRRKGHDSVLAAMHALRDELPDLIYVIVGDGGERARLAALAVRLGLARRVHFEGEVGAAALPAYYAAADLFVLPTRVEPGDFEGFGLVFLEAAAAGRPAIGGRNGGVPEAISDGETGLLVDGADVRDLASAIRSLATSPALRAELGAAGRRRVLRQFTWDRAAQAVLAIHAEVARQPPGAPRRRGAPAPARRGAAG